MIIIGEERIKKYFYFKGKFLLLQFIVLYNRNGCTLCIVDIFVMPLLPNACSKWAVELVVVVGYCSTIIMHSLGAMQGVGVRETSSVRAT